MIFALLTKSETVRNAISEFVEREADCQPLYFELRTDLIRHLTSRAAIDVVVIDADQDLEAVGRIASWRSCHTRSDFKILVLGQFLSAEAMARAFEMGGDDIVVGHFNVGEVYARATRCYTQLRSQKRETTHIELGDYVLDQWSQRVSHRGEYVKLTAREFAIAWLFFSNPGALLSRPRIAMEIWGQASDHVGRALEQHVYKLRRKLSLLGDASVELKAVYAAGYRLEPAPGSQRGLRDDARSANDAMSERAGHYPHAIAWS
ncbi:response regulator transcription factor [Robbsia sp. KACC 23696]|uniref:winged helix-turn-helix transcriptional regulator n=1 Tax=Robbsia sp. KACC 23696 TaxID=3149231 RepID=UPI00325B2186